MPEAADVAEPPAKNSYGQYCPITRAVEVLGERWSILIVRDMLVGARRFNDIARGLPGLSRSLLTKRLRELERSGVVERLDGEYLLTPAGELEPLIVFGLGEWAAKWSFDDPRPGELDGQLLVWWIHRRVDTSVLGDRKRTVLEIRFSDDPRLFWLVADARGDTSVCLSDPGYDVDVTIASDLESLYRIWMGQLPMKQAMRAGRITFSGPSALVRRMPEVLQLSEIAEAVSQAQAS